MAGIEAFFEEQDPDEVVDMNSGGEVPTTEEVVETTPPEETPVVETEVPEETKEPIAEAKTTEQDDLAEQVASLRTLVREQAAVIEKLAGQSDKVTSALTSSGTIDANDLLPAEDEEPGVTEERYEALTLLAETMRINPKFPDFDEVCTQTNFEKTVEALARTIQQDEGGTLTNAMNRVNTYIWNLPNPYKYVYDLLKEHHPKYKTSGKEETVVPKEKPKAPPSLAKVAGGSPAGKEGWSAAKIDALSEDQLHTVPAAVYEKYMQGLLQ